jgi:hypothetical protein
MNTLTLVLNRFSQTLIFRIYKHFIIDSIIIVKNSGFKELIRQRGWKFFLIIFAYYLVRDSLVYVIIPVCIAKGDF